MLVLVLTITVEVVTGVEVVEVTMLPLVEGVLTAVVTGVVACAVEVVDTVELDFDEPSARYAPTPTTAIITIITTTIAAAAIPLFFRLKSCLILKCEMSVERWYLYC
jgi:hypothetical protein